MPGGAYSGSPIAKMVAMTIAVATSLPKQREKTSMTALDFAPLLAQGLPPAAAKWTGFPKYNFTGGHNDGEQVPLDKIVKAANDVLTREGRTLATYGLESGP